MQSNYGVSEIQQFMVEGGFSSLFSVSTADMNSSAQLQKHHHQAHQIQQQQQHHHHLQQQQQYHHQHQQLQRQHPNSEHPHLHHHHHHLAPQLPPVPPPPPQPLPFPQFPVTQQLFQRTHQFHVFQQEQQQRQMRQQQVHLGLDKAPTALVNSGSPARIVPAPASGGCGGDGSASGGRTGLPPFLSRVNFDLDVNESTGGGSGDGLNDEEDVVQCGEGSESRLHPWSTGEAESAIKEPFWRPLDVDFINRNSERCTEKLLDPSVGGEEHGINRDDRNNAADGGNASKNYKLFSELEAICKPGGGGGSSFSGGGNRNLQHTTASISALLDRDPPIPTVVGGQPELRPDGDPSTVDAADQGSNASTEEEEAALPPKTKKSSGGTSRKRKRKQELSSVARFLESLVRRLMEHQEGLHRKFLELLERRDEERMNQEERWRQQETAKASREATARAEEQALASTREAAIISFLEKITGERLDLPAREQFQEDLQQKETTDQYMEQSPVAQTAATGGSGGGSAAAAANQGFVNSNRWPKAEVQVLIRVRSSLEPRFQEPGPKGPLWEEVSATMAAVGYHRSAKRCKEKWENINKYFRRAKDRAKKRARDSKTCPYFHQLDQLYSKTATGTQPPASAVPASATVVSSTQTATLELPGVDPMTLGFHNWTEKEDDDGENEVSYDAADIGRGPPAPRRRGSCQAENDGGVGGQEEDEREGGGDGDEDGDGRACIKSLTGYKAAAAAARAGGAESRRGGTE